MKLKIILNTILVLGAVLIGQSCENEGENETKISSKNSNESHKMGENCMSCHKKGSSGEGWFNVAGTVYTELKTTAYPNATIKFYTEPNGAGTLKYTVFGDARGNFYTTENIDFGSGLYTSVQGATTTNHMISPVTSGQCNSCHSSSTEKIWIK